MTKKTNQESLNFRLYKRSHEELSKTKSELKRLLKYLIKILPREETIEILTKLKIIEQDWFKKGTKFKLRKG